MLGRLRLGLELSMDGFNRVRGYNGVNCALQSGCPDGTMWLRGAAFTFGVGCR
ncbi:MAG: hypothetical protein ABR567_23140 [Myxococcales bacterium]|nr:hypothetical protein [Myxococcales bacterium]